jgi:dinuclear metal center YbgI/SA1388 family protein
MRLSNLEKKLNQKLDIGIFASSDPSMNGIQVGDTEQEITKIVLLVDASLEGFKMAAKHNADLIICHHGLFWGRPIAIKGSHYKRVKYLMDNNISLYASHLPLDAHFEVGNNIGLADQIGLTDCEQFGKYKGNKIGVKGILKEPLTLDDIKKIILGDNEPAYIVPGGKNKISSVGIVSGGSPYSLLEAIDEDLDLFITGDKSHELYHTCLEEQINMISAGHYATEKWGVKLLGQWIEKEFGINCIFLDIPSGA